MSERAQDEAPQAPQPPDPPEPQPDLSLIGYYERGYTGPRGSKAQDTGK